jgi:type IV pilus assembly protein PilQ
VSTRDVLSCARRAAFVAASVFLVSASPAFAQEEAQPDLIKAAVSALTGAEGQEDPQVPPEGVKMGGSGVFEELHIRDADIRRALEMLNVQARRNIITTKEVTGNVTADLYRVTFREALDALLRANGYVYEERGNFLYVMTAEQHARMVESQRKLSFRVFQLSYISATDARALIAPMLSEEGMVAMTPAAATGVTSSSTDSGGNSYATSDVLVVRDYEDNLRRIEQAVRELDSKPEQVLIEATLLRASIDEDNALGVDFNVLSGVDFNTLSATTAGLTSVNTANSVPVMRSNGAGAVNHQAVTFRTDFNASVPAGGLSVGFVSQNVGFFVRALESITDVTVMANPKLLVVNKQRGEVFVGREDGYLTTTFTETTASQTVEMLQTGTRMVVRPFIGRDDYVRLEIHPEDSSGVVAVVGQNALPSKATTEVTSNVLVRDGHTIVIGGLFREETSATRSQLPLLGNIPYVGALWRSTSDSNGREEVIVLITPRIIRQEADEALCEQVKDTVERFRIGQRKGLRWWGRSRLAQSCIRKARTALSEGNRERALWHVDTALSMLPQMEEAVRLRGQLTGKAYWSEEGRYSTARYLIQKMVMNELGKPVDSVIPPAKPRDGAELDEDVRRAFNITGLNEVPLPPAAHEAMVPAVVEEEASPTEEPVDEELLEQDPAVEEPVELPASDDEQGEGDEPEPVPSDPGASVSGEESPEGAQDVDVLDGSVAEPIADSSEVVDEGDDPDAQP